MNLKSKIAKKSKLGPGSAFYNTLIVLNFSRGRELLMYLGSGMIGLQVGGYPHRKTRALLAVNSGRVKHDVRGLLQAETRNMERMEEAIPEADHQALQHMLSESAWPERAVLDQVAQDANRLLGGHPDSALLIDESGCPKKGMQSVGVARQWCGQLGKVENCQVGVFAALSRGPDVTLIDARLFLPEAWTSDSARCRAAGIPRAQRGFQRKVDPGLGDDRPRPAAGPRLCLGRF
jgi:hypothetical protein